MTDSGEGVRLGGNNGGKTKTSTQGAAGRAANQEPLVQETIP